MYSKVFIKYSILILAIITCTSITTFYVLKHMKFDTVVSLTVVKGPFKGINFKLMNYPVSLKDLDYQQDFWNSPLGISLFNQLSSTLQTIVKAGSSYIILELDMYFLGIFHRHYNICDAIHAAH